MGDPAQTIVAIATPAGEGGIGIVRVSGAAVPHIASTMFTSRSGRPLLSYPPFRLTLGAVLAPGTGERIDEVLAVHMPAGRSFTREPMAEFQAHGGPAVLERIVSAACACGARLAGPGEFTKRAFLSGRIDLSQAEAVVDLIRAASESDRRLALRRLEGEIGGEVRAMREELLDLLSEAEGILEFAEEDGLEERLDRSPLSRTSEAARSLVERGAAARCRPDGCRVVIVGRVNTGKSSLFNRLSGFRRSIVTSLPGTTRDYVETRTFLNGFPVTIVDTAGFGLPKDAAEEEGMCRSRAQAEASDIVVIAMDGSTPLGEHDIDLLASLEARSPLIAVTKCDLPRRFPVDLGAAHPAAAAWCECSSLTGEGVSRLAAMIAGRCREILASDQPADRVSPNTRQVDVLRRFLARLESAGQLLDASAPLEIVVFELRSAFSVLGEITGETATEEVLDRIFSRFCVGK